MITATLCALIKKHLAPKAAEVSLNRQMPKADVLQQRLKLSHLFFCDKEGRLTNHSPRVVADSRCFFHLLHFFEFKDTGAIGVYLQF